MFIKSIHGSWVNTSYIDVLDVKANAENVTVRAIGNDGVIFILHQIPHDGIPGPDDLDKAQSWLDCYIHEIGLD